MSQEICPIIVEGSTTRRRAEPVTLGIPLPTGWCCDEDVLGLIDQGQRPVPLQVRVLGRWSDRSIRWLLVDFQADCEPETSATYRLLNESPPVSHSSPVAVSIDAHAVGLDTGAAVFRVPRAGAFAVTALKKGSTANQPATAQLFLERRTGSARVPQIMAVRVLDSGPLRARVHIAAADVPPRSPRLEFDLVLDVFAGSRVMRCAVTIRNPQAATHPGGIWELGDPGSVLLRALSLVVHSQPGEGQAVVRYSCEPGVRLQRAEGRLELYQDSSGGENWQSSNHVNREGVVCTSFRGYRVRDGNREARGERATPVVTVDSDGRSIAVGMQHFWQNFPKSIEGSEAGITVHLFPPQFSDLHELQGGEQKTHVIGAAFDADTVSELPLEWIRAPLFARSTPQWYCGSAAVPYLIPADEDPNTAYLRLVNVAIEGEHSFERKREIIDEYGWRNFGDLYADHEAVFHKGPQLLISHYNNQYDAAAGMAYHFLRTGDRRWWSAFLELTAHVVDIDVYHTRRDKSAYNGGMFWHTYHYVDAGKSTHRSYPSLPGVCGGGPSNEHDYSTGLMLRYLLTGDEFYREATLALAEWVINMDDGRQTVFRWLAHTPTGLASATGSPLYHGPGRGAAYSITTLLNAHSLAGEAKYMMKAEELIRRCISPRDDINGLRLLDAERRWYYTVFLQALGSYLDYRAEMRQLDEMYGYARLSLLHYAKWMSENEYPYLDKPDILEYPTETWAALDMRKSDVFKYAAKYSPETDRPHYLERARFFFRYSISALSQMHSHTLTRPTVLLLLNGYMQGWYDRRPDTSGATFGGNVEVGSPTPFIPQRLKARDRLVRIACGLLLAAVGVAAAWLRR